MKELLLLRHAKSSWAEPHQEDVDRPLNKRGRKGAALIGTWLSENAIRPGLVLSSSARRTRETLDLLHDALGPNVQIQIEPGLYLADAGRLLQRVRAIQNDVGSVLVIAHNPGLQDLAVDLAHAAKGDRTLRDTLIGKFPTAALARFRFDVKNWKDVDTDADPGAITLVDYITPAGLDDD
jgi:phosphohistidine phosphatase